MYSCPSVFLPPWGKEYQGERISTGEEICKEGGGWVKQYPFSLTSEKGVGVGGGNKRKLFTTLNHCTVGETEQSLEDQEKAKTITEPLYRRGD